MEESKSRLFRLWQAMGRRKVLEKDPMSTPLKRSLTWFHLTLFGIGQMAGAGVYVLTGTAVKTQSGPATFISYMIAGLCALFAALCYAEFGARCPKAGSAYTYSYLTIGEFVGFSIGWNLLLEHSIGAASTARAWGGALDSLVHNAISNWTNENIGSLNLFGHAFQPDLTSALIIIVLTGFIVYGAELSMIVTATFSLINAITTVFIVVLGLSMGSITNWQEPDGFAPHGVPGVISGAAMLFYSYVGFDAIAMAGEEASNPSRAIPIANTLSIGIVMLMYVSMSIALTLAVPYNLINPTSAFPDAFKSLGISWAPLMINIVMILVIQGSTISALFAGPRCAYSMASDGLLFKSLAYVHPWTQTPVIAIVVFATISAVSAVLLNVETLAEFVSLGTLMASLIVSVSVIILRYQPELQIKGEEEHLTADVETQTGTLNPKFHRLSLLSSNTAGKAPKYAALLLCMFLLLIAAFALLPEKFSWWTVSGLVLSTAGGLICYLVLVIHQQAEKTLTFQIPFVPLLPTLSMLTISCLLVRLSPMSWMRFVVWMIVGLAIYFGYGIRHSNENSRMKTIDYVTLKSTSENDVSNNGSLKKKDYSQF